MLRVSRSRTAPPLRGLPVQLPRLRQWVPEDVRIVLLPTLLPVLPMLPIMVPPVLPMLPTVLSKILTMVRHNRRPPGEGD
jgi:hypothetical protein